MPLPSVVQATKNASGGTSVTSLTCAYASDVTAGDTLVALVGFNNNGQALSGNTVTDTQGNTWSQVVGDNTFPTTVVFSAIAGSSGPNTVTAHAAASAELTLGIAELANSGAVDKTAAPGATFVGSNTATTAATTQASEIVLVVAFFVQGSSGVTVGPDPSGYSPDFVLGGGVGTTGIALWHQVVSSTGTQTATVTASPSNTAINMAIVTFKAASAGPAFLAPPNKPILQAVNRSATY